MQSKSNANSLFSTKRVYKADVDGADDYDGWFSSVCAGHLNLIVAADDGTFTRVTVTRVLLPFEEGGGGVVA